MKLLDNNKIGSYFSLLSDVIRDEGENQGIHLINEDRKRQTFIQEEEETKYQSNFFTFPLDTISAQKHFTISYSFYEMDIWGANQYNSEDPEQLENSLSTIQNKANDHIMRESFVWNKLSERYHNIIEAYPGNILQLNEALVLSENTPEEIIVINLINYYKNILKDKNIQLRVFDDIIVTKNVADIYTLIWIAFFKARLNTLNPKYVLEEENPNEEEVVEDYICKELIKNIDSTPIDPSTEKLIIETLGEEFQKELELEEEHGKDAIIQQLPENFSSNKNESANLKLDIKQTAILFYQLKKHKAIYPFSDQALAKLVSNITGHSEQNIRTKKGFGAYWDLIKESREGMTNFHAKKVKEFLQAIIDELDKEIK